MGKIKEKFDKFTGCLRKHDKEVKFICVTVGAGVCCYFIGQGRGISYMENNFVCVPRSKIIDLIHNAYDLGMDAVAQYIKENVPSAHCLISNFEAEHPDISIVVPEALINSATGSITLKSK